MAFIRIGNALVLAEEEAHFACAYTDVAGRDVHVSAHILVELCHEGLAEAHHFRIRLSVRIEVRAALAAADGKRGQRILEDLFKAEELQDSLIDRGMETKAALVRSDGVVELDAVASLYMNLSFIVRPRNAEGDNAVRLHKPLKERNFSVLLFICVDDGADGLHHLSDSLKEFRLMSIFLPDRSENFINV